MSNFFLCRVTKRKCESCVNQKQEFIFIELTQMNIVNERIII